MIRRKTIFTDGGYWYNTACRWLRLIKIASSNVWYSIEEYDGTVHSAYQGQD